MHISSSGEAEGEKASKTFAACCGLMNNPNWQSIAGAAILSGASAYPKWTGAGKECNSYWFVSPDR
ncbi:hypothetical protein [Sinorhizobium fredii]|uniref:hypothetical protein n=1 Tax=Rhizobium fredii TaxID=380 RepID=UPI00117EEAF5|nr:hypothetical protein [Sinorhizobium fredii]